jgi:hypothetical protein
MTEWLASPPFLVVAGLLVGIVLGLTGAGGSVLTVPALVALLRLSPHHAVAASLLCVGSTAVVGALPHARRGHVELRPAVVFALVGGLAALAGGRLGREVDEALLMTLFGLLMLFVAWRMFRNGAPPGPGRDRASSRRLAGYGGGVGALSGFLGVGGGFLIVPALNGPGGLPMKHAIGTGLAIVAVNAFAGLAGALSTLEGIPWQAVIPFVLGSVGGGWVGARLAARWSANRLQLAFALLVAGIGITMTLVYGERLASG